MRNSLPLLLFSIILFSCSNDFLEDSSAFHQQDKALLKTNNDSIPIISSYEELFKLFGIESKDVTISLRSTGSIDDTITVISDTIIPGCIYPPPPKFPFDIFDEEPLDNRLEDITITGYSSVRNSGASRVLFNADMANIFGLISGRIYQTYVKYVETKVTFPSGYSFFENDSPRCGFAPYYNGGTNYYLRGYQAGSTSSPITLITHIFHVNDEWSSINKDYPCTPAQVEWNYSLWRY